MKRPYNVQRIALTELIGNAIEAAEVRNGIVQRHAVEGRVTLTIALNSRAVHQRFHIFVVEEPCG